VSPDGDDAASGLVGAPLRSIQLAADKAVTATPPRAVVLRAGTHFLESQLLLTARHSGLRIVSFPGERASVSGGKKLQIEWKPYKVDAKSGDNIWVADINGQARPTTRRTPSLAPAPARNHARCNTCSRAPHPRPRIRPRTRTYPGRACATARR
jgi:hypothetical protein